MSALNNSILIGASGLTGYQISRSVRLRSSATAFFGRTPTTTTNRRTFTWSGWVKLGLLSTAQRSLFTSQDNNTSSGNLFDIYIANNCLSVVEYASAYRIYLITTQVFRDPSSWYHVVVAIDTTQATAANRALVYVNGVQVTSFSTATYPSQNTDLFMNVASQPLGIGVRPNPSGNVYYYDGYFTEVNFIDGQALTPSSFGETNTTTGVWQPKRYTGTYGTNGFYLNFSDNTGATATTIGADYSGNGNNWTPNNISVTAGATYDSMIDVPTQWADGGNGRGNYATLNPLDKNASLTVSDGNLGFQASTTAAQGVRSTFAIPSGLKIYAECLFTTWTTGSANYAQFGIATSTASLSSDIGNASGTGFSIEANQLTNTILRLNGSSVTITGAVASGDVFQVAVDLDNLKVWLGKNNTWYDSAGGTTGNPATGANATGTLTSGAIYFPAALKYGTANAQAANFGQRPFAYTPPTGFKALNTLNLPTPTILKGNQYFDATTYTGTGASLNVVNSGGMQPDFVWTKPRSTAVGHTLFDSLRGVTKYLQSNTTGAEGTAATSLTAFNSDGFTVNSDTSTGANGVTYVGWQWRANGTPAVTNTAGSITSTISAGATQGFSIVTYTGTGANATVGHGLGVAPDMIIVKRRSATDSWPVYHSRLTSAANTLVLNSTAAQQTVTTYWNSTAPTSSVFTVGTDSAVNASGSTYVAYCFDAVAGFSAFGSYTGNGSADGPFVYLGFRPRFIMFKRTDATSNWLMIDTARSTYNQTNEVLLPNSSAAEGTGAGYGAYDFLSNGFKPRNVVANETNVNGGTYIYAAFAENPFKNALAR
jgi:hypothetical protein